MKIKSGIAAAAAALALTGLIGTAPAQAGGGVSFVLGTHFDGTHVRFGVDDRHFHRPHYKRHHGRHARQRYCPRHRGYHGRGHFKKGHHGRPHRSYYESHRYYERRESGRAHFYDSRRMERISHRAHVPGR